MSAEPQLFRIDPETRESESITEVEFAQLGFQERRDIQEWVAANPSILGEDLLIIGKEFSGFDRTNERLDLLAVDADGTLVIIELKRDHSGADAHWQAIKYASYFRQAKQDILVRMLAEYSKVSEDEAGTALLQHIGADDLGALNNDQRIILASHRFAPEVTSAALWLNEKAPDDNLITCVQLTPYQDGDALYIQSNTIIPPPMADDYAIGIGETMPSSGGDSPSSFATKIARTFDRNRNDAITKFFKGTVRGLVLNSLSGDVKPDINSRWAVGNPNWRSYHFWYSRPPWGNWEVFYRINLLPRKDDDGGYWRGEVGVQCIVKNTMRKFALTELEIESLETILTEAKVHENQQFHPDDKGFSLSVNCESRTLDSDFADTIASIIKPFIEEITPALDDFENSRNEEPIP